METLEELKAIVENAPEDAKAVMMVCNPIYAKLESNTWYAACKGQDWVQVLDKQIGIMRSLSDIEKIIELEDDRGSLLTELYQGGQIYGDLIK